MVVQTEEQLFDPWGRPGGGAPITNENGKVVTTTQQHFNDKKEVSKTSVFVSVRVTVSKFITANW